MQILLIIGALAIAILLLDKFHTKLPPPFPQIHAVWTKFSHTLGVIMSWIILSILWIVAFGPYAIAYKLMNRKADTNQSTYWQDITEESNLKYQF